MIDSWECPPLENHRNVGLAVRLGVGHVAIQIVFVDEVQDLVQHLLAAGAQTLDVLPVPLCTARQHITSSNKSH